MTSYEKREADLRECEKLLCEALSRLTGPSGGEAGRPADAHGNDLQAEAIFWRCCRVARIMASEPQVSGGSTAWAAGYEVYDAAPFVFRGLCDIGIAAVWHHEEGARLMLAGFERVAKTMRSSLDERARRDKA
ncbi:hypothetical protein [Mangrovicoccus sp. HB161399]|uniref:hypothetical protein n=1 Tax=Mangrovicoccus sp. HB161399 TaxID=2720392 RepID=UPI00155626A2|nr:hypothetical protein [Mangrovicoccus sp. HB161399]